MEFGKKLKELRTAKGVSQSELAEKIFVSRSAVAKWENGLGLPSGESMRLLAEYFAVSTDELCSDQSSESVIVKKNVTISKSRKLLIAITAVSIAVIITLVVCLAVFVSKNNGNEDDPGGVAYIIGIRSSLYDDDGKYIDLWADYDRTALSDTCLQVGNTYKIKVDPIHNAVGNNKPSYDGISVQYFDSREILFEYEDDIFDIQADNNEREFVLIVKKSCKLATIEIKYMSFRDYMIISANAPADMAIGTGAEKNNL